MVAFPNSNMQVKKTVLKGSTLALTPQESEQLSVYVSDDRYVKKQKEDIEELASLFKGMLGEETDTDEYTPLMKENFYPLDGFKALFRIDLTDKGFSLVVDIDEKELDCYRGTAETADVIAKVGSEVFSDIVHGKKTFQSAFMSGVLSAQGNFKILRNFDTVFRFN